MANEKKGLVDITTGQEVSNANANGILDLTSDEITQIANINTSTISTSQWGYVGALNQSLTTSNSPTFVGLTLTGLSTGGILFSNGSDVLTQDTSNLYWDDTNNRLGIGINAPSAVLHVQKGVSIGNNLVYFNNTFGGGGGTVLKIETSSGNIDPAVIIQNNGVGVSLRINDVVSDTTPFIVDASGKIGIGTPTPTVSLDISAWTDAILIPKGTTLEQPASASNGMLRYNTDTNKFEGYENGAWVNLI